MDMSYAAIEEGTDIITDDESDHIDDDRMPVAVCTIFWLLEVTYSNNISGFPCVRVS